MIYYNLCILNNRSVPLTITLAVQICTSGYLRHAHTEKNIKTFSVLTIVFFCWCCSCFCLPVCLIFFFLSIFHFRFGVFVFVGDYNIIFVQIGLNINMQKSFFVTLEYVLTSRIVHHNYLIYPPVNPEFTPALIVSRAIKCDFVVNFKCISRRQIRGYLYYEVYRDNYVTQMGLVPLEILTHGSGLNFTDVFSIFEGAAWKQ